MASAFDHMKNMNDIKFKARRLNTLIQHHVPDEEHPFKDYSSASRIKNEILTHGLLSEFEVVDDDDDDKDSKSLFKWRRAVDLWEQRLMDLVSSDSTGNCWFGISFLGLTSQVIGFKRFEASYALWLQKLLPLAQSPVASELVKVALWYSLSDILTRLALGDFPDGKRDGVSFAGKLVQPLLNSFSETKSRDALEGAATILCTIVNLFPTAVNRHSDAFEASVVKNLFIEKDKLTILAQCLAELPKSKGDEMSWSLMMQKLLISINMHLNYVFQGLEEDSISDEAIRRLIPPGRERPLPLGRHEVSPEAAESVSKYLLLCCLKLLTSSYPVPVTVPVDSILALIERVLNVDGSLAKSTYPFITVMQQESACSQLPMLHEHCLDMLAALIKLVGSQLLPHSPKIERLLIEYFDRCAVPRLRDKIYSTLQIMLKSMGPGIGWHIRKYVIKNAFRDLEPFVISARSNLSKSSNIVSKEPLLVPCSRKRKHGVATESPNLHQNVGFEVEATSAMISALDMLNTLLLKDCLSNEDNLKSQVDNLLISVANAACKKRGWTKEVNNTKHANWADIQAASLKALKTSFLSPTSVRPPHLSEGLTLFRRGALHAGTKIDDVCIDALASLEVVIHPRTLSVADFDSTASSYAANGYQTNNTIGMVADERDTDEDILFRTFLENEYEVEIPTSNPIQKEDSLIKHLHADITTSKSDYPKPSADTAQEPMIVNLVDEAMIEQEQPSHSHEGPTIPSVTSVEVNENISKSVTTNVSVSQGRNSMAAIYSDDGFGSEFTTPAAVNATKTTMFQVLKSDNTDDMDLIPDIVDAEPDSDSD